MIIIMIIIIIHTLNYTLELRKHLTVLVPYQNSVLVAIVFIDVEYSTLMPSVTIGRSNRRLQL